MNTKTLLALISVVEILFLVIIDVLGNKLSELINWNPVLILVLTFVLVTILAWITFYKFNIVDRKIDTIALPNPRIRFTQTGVKKLMWWLVYIPIALLLSIGAVYLSNKIEKGWLALLPTIVVSGTLFAYPVFRDQAIEQGHKVLPLQIAWVLSIVYASAGFVLSSTPELFDSYLIIFALISAATMTGLKYAYLFHIIKTIFEPWYRNLPES